MKGRLIVLEGIDGCGKSTQIRRLAEWLPKSDLFPKKASLRITREPGGSKLGKKLREFLLTKEEGESPLPLTELMLYAADRAQHVEEVIRPCLEKGDWVISDRFSGSTFAYQGYGRKLNLELIETLDLIATNGLKPDLTLWLKISVEESIHRRKDMEDDRMEKEGIAFLNRVNDGFKRLAKKEKCVEIDAEKDADSVFQSIENAINIRLRKIN